MYQAKNTDYRETSCLHVYEVVAYQHRLIYYRCSLCKLLKEEHLSDLRKTASPKLGWKASS